MLTTRLQRFVVATALTSVAASAALGASIPTDSGQSAEISVVAVAGAQVEVPVAAAAGLPADLATFHVTRAGVGALRVTGGAVAYTAPGTVPAANLSGPARAATDLPPATVVREALPVVAAEPPEPSPSPTTEPGTPTPSPTTDPTPAPTGLPSSTPTATPSASSTAAPEPDPTEAAEPDDGETDTPPAESTPAAPLVGTGTDTPVGDSISYQVCAKGGSACTTGTVTVTFAPSVLTARTVTSRLVETDQQARLTPAELISNPAAADTAGITAVAARGRATVQDGDVVYTAPTDASTDTVTVRACSLGDHTACVTIRTPFTVAPAFTTDKDTTVAVTSDRRGVATVAVPTRAGSGPRDPATVSVIRQPSHATTTTNGTTFTYRLRDTAFAGADAFTWRACAAANRDNCRTSTMHLTVNDGFGWISSDQSIVAGLTTTFDVRNIAADATRWGLQLPTVTVTGPDDVTVQQVAPGVYRVGVSTTRHDPFTLRICGAGRNDVKQCGAIQFTVTPMTVIPDPRPPLLQAREQSPGANLPTVTPAAADAPHPQAGQQRNSTGTDITWWVVGAAMLFGIGGGAGALRNRH